MHLASDDGDRLKHLIDNASFGRIQWQVASLCFLAAMVEGFDVQAVAFIAPIVSLKWHIPSSEFGAVFAAGLVGLCIGSAVVGPLSDRYGRRGPIITAMVIIGLSSILTMTSGDMTQLVAWRFLTGLGLGGLLPNVFSLTAEYVPARIRATAVTAMFCGFPVGGVIGGAACAQAIPIYGWQIVFLIGGIFPLALVPLLTWKLPESLSYLVLSGAPQSRIQPILAAIDPGGRFEPGVQAERPVGKQQLGAVSHLFASSMIRMTILLWTLFFTTLFTLYFLVNWLPIILRGAGVSMERALSGTVLFNFGGVLGALIMAWMSDRWGAVRVLLPGYTAAAVSVAALGLFAHSGGSALLLTLVAGFFVLGCNFVIAAWASELYPTSVRATGVGWSLSVGRIGSILGPLLGSVMIGLHWEASQVLTVGAVPSAISALAILVFRKSTLEHDRVGRALTAQLELQ
jgi:AAHS family 4-hydroxybenzoate transporter-like MFS transporter